MTRLFAIRANVVEDRILNGYNNSHSIFYHEIVVVEDRILNGYNNEHLSGWQYTSVVEDRILNGYNNLRSLINNWSMVVEDRILNGYNNSIVTTTTAFSVVEDRILNGYNNVANAVWQQKTARTLRQGFGMAQWHSQRAIHGEYATKPIWQLSHRPSYFIPEPWEESS